MLRLVLIRVSPRGLSPKGLRRPVFSPRGLIFEGLINEDETYLDLDLYLLLSACFLGLVDDIRGWSDSSEYWSEADLGPTSCFL